MKLKNKLQYYLTGKCIKYLRNCAEKRNSGYIRYAKSEMDIVWPGWDKPSNEDDGMQKMMCDDVLDLLSMLDTQGDSGFSIGYKLNLLNKLIRFKPLSPLTFDDSEFNECGGFLGDKTYQNKRLSSVFMEIDEKENKKYHYLDGISKRDYGYVRTKADGSNEYELYFRESSACCNGGTFVIMKNGTIRWSNLRAYIKDTTKFDPDKKFYVPQYQIEYPYGWWISFVREEDLKEARKFYDIKIEDKEVTAEILNREIKEFQNGQYELELTNRIHFLIGELRNNHSNNDLLNYVKTKRIINTKSRTKKDA